MISLFENSELLAELHDVPSELEKQISGYLIIFIVIGLVLLSIYLLREHNKNKEWKQGVFPSKLNYNRESLLRAYICLAANMMRRDNRENARKRIFITNFLKKEFSTSKLDYVAYLKFSLKYPIQLETVCHWLNIHLNDVREKLQIIHLLVGVSILDGGIVKNELWLLRELVRLLNLNQKELDSILSKYLEEEQKRILSNSKLSNRENALNILGLDQNVTIKEIKKAYRKLVMINHPDKFSLESKEQVQLAQERFLKIQEAYEFLVK